MPNTIRVFDTDRKRDVVILTASIRYACPARNPGLSVIACEGGIEIFTDKPLEEIERVLGGEMLPTGGESKEAQLLAVIKEWQADSRHAWERVAVVQKERDTLLAATQCYFHPDYWEGEKPTRELTTTIGRAITAVTNPRPQLADAAKGGG